MEESKEGHPTRERILKLSSYDVPVEKIKGSRLWTWILLTSECIMILAPIIQERLGTQLRDTKNISTLIKQNDSHFRQYFSVPCD